MNNFIKPLMIALAAVSMLAACAQKEEAALDPYATNFVYMKAPSINTFRATYSTLKVWKNKPDSIASFVQVRCTKPAPKDIKVSVEIDESMVEAYNAANGTDYLFLPEIKLLQDSYTIKKGEYVSVDTLKARISDYSTLLNGTQSYVVPVKLSSTSAGTLSESSFFYLFYEASELFAEMTNVYTGVKMDRSGWKVYKDSFDGEDITRTVTDGNTYSDVYGSGYKGPEVVLCIDLGAVYDNITNVGVEPYGNYATYTVDRMKVEISVDNVEYKDLGTYNCRNLSAAVLDLYDPQQARYIKITGYDPLSTSYGWDIGEIYVGTAE